MKQAWISIVRHGADVSVKHNGKNKVVFFPFGSGADEWLEKVSPRTKKKWLDQGWPCMLLISKLEWEMLVRMS